MSLAAAFAAFFVLRELVGSGSLCYWRTLSGFPCPGCGLTSSGFALLRGDVLQSLKYQPFLIPVLTVFAVILLHKRIKLFERLHTSKWFYPSFLILFVGFYVIRLILFFPNGPYPMIYTHRSLLGKAITLVWPAKDSSPTTPDSI